MALHSTLTGADLHESKGVASASVNTVYVADGSGSGSWQKIKTTSLDTSSIKDTNIFYVTVVFKDISTPGNIVIPIDDNFTLVSARSVLNAAITVANCGITISKNGGTTLSTGTIAFSGSAKGTTNAYSISANSLVPGDYIEIISDGASTTASDATFLLKFQYQ